MSPASCFALLVPLLLHCQVVFAETSSAERILKEEVQRAEKIPLRDGDHCLVGDIPIDHQTGVGILLRGRRVTVANVMVEEFQNNPTKYFSKLQPKAALFTETADAARPTWVWTIGGILVLVLVALGGLSSAAAIRHGQDARKWFFLGLCGNILAPFLARRGALLSKPPEGHTKLPTTVLPVACPQCGYENHPSADQCGSCGGALEPAYESEAKKARSE